MALAYVVEVESAYTGSVATGTHTQYIEVTVYLCAQPECEICEYDFDTPTNGGSCTQCYEGFDLSYGVCLAPEDEVATRAT